MTTLYLSRAGLRRDASTSALAALLVPENDRDRPYAEHRLVWSLFADGPERERDFLWRSEGPGRFTVLSHRPPEDPHSLFEVSEPKPFEPNLRPGDRLHFNLRANPVVARKETAGARGKIRDVVMDALYTVPHDARNEQRWACIQTAGRAWLLRQGEANGFVPVGDPGIDGYTRVRLPRSNGKDAEFRSLDFSGVLEVRDPDRFLARLAQGFGRAKAFGCGLMLIRRVR